MVLHNSYRYILTHALRAIPLKLSEGETPPPPRKKREKGGGGEWAEDPPSFLGLSNVCLRGLTYKKKWGLLKKRGFVFEKRGVWVFSTRKKRGGWGGGLGETRKKRGRGGVKFPRGVSPLTFFNGIAQEIKGNKVGINQKALCRTKGSLF